VKEAKVQEAGVIEEKKRVKTPAIIEINEAWCKGCDICVQFCPKNVLKLNRRGKAEVVNLDDCTKCQLCELLCPDFAITVK